MQIEPWQVPVLVTAGTVVLTLLVDVIAGRIIKKLGQAAILNAKRLRTGALALLAALGIVIFVWTALGSETAHLLVALATGIIEAQTLWLTYRSYKDQKSTDFNISNT